MRIGDTVPLLSAHRRVVITATVRRRIPRFCSSNAIPNQNSTSPACHRPRGSFTAVRPHRRRRFPPRSMVPRTAWVEKDPAGVVRAREVGPLSGFGFACLGRRQPARGGELPSVQREVLHLIDGIVDAVHDRPPRAGEIGDPGVVGDLLTFDERNRRSAPRRREADQCTALQDERSGANPRRGEQPAGQIKLTNVESDPVLRGGGRRDP
jgi:hypothetical protein